MDYKISSDKLDIVISDDGGELRSIINIENGYEYLWQGDPKYWPRRSPVLFPFIGRLNDSKYRYKNIEYTMPMHGFLRDRKLKVENVKDDMIDFYLCYDEESLRIYPFKFEIRLHFEVNNNTLKVSSIIKNLDDKEMFYNLGFHPGYNVDLNKDVLLELNYNDDICRYGVKDGQIFRFNDKFKGNKILIDNSYFNDDTFILENIKKVSLENNGHRIETNMSDMSFLAVWTKMIDGEMSPYICIEPFSGLAQRIDEDNEITKKRDIRVINKNEVQELNVMWKFS